MSQGLRNDRYFKAQKAFKDAGFDFHTEVIKALSELPAEKRAEMLIALAPYFMTKQPTLKITAKATKKSIDVTNSVPKAITEADTESLMRLLNAGQENNNSDSDE